MWCPNEAGVPRGEERPPEAADLAAFVRGDRRRKRAPSSDLMMPKRSRGARRRAAGQRRLRVAAIQRKTIVDFLLDRYMWAYFSMFTKPNLPNNWRYKKNSLAKRFSKLPNDNFFQVDFSKQLEMLLAWKTNGGCYITNTHYQQIKTICRELLSSYSLKHTRTHWCGTRQKPKYTQQRP